MATEGLEDSWRQLALELLVTIAENAPAMMRKHGKFLPKIGQHSLSFLAECMPCLQSVWRRKSLFGSESRGS